MFEDNSEEIMCPACHKKMAKIWIEDAKCSVDICIDGCGGIFFDNRELEKFDEEHENIDEILAQLKDKEFQSVDESVIRVCPLCASGMVKQKTSSLENSPTIDVCYTCGAKFLDLGELEKIRAEYKTEKERKDAFNKSFYAEYKSDFEKLDQEKEECKLRESFILKILKNLKRI